MTQIQRINEEDRLCEEFAGNTALPGVGVMRVHGEYRLLSAVSFQPGDLIFEIKGELTNTPSRYSLQLDHHTHIDLSDSHDMEEILDRYYWRFLNHSCEPNAFIRGLQVIALRPIRPWEEISFNYNSTEYDMAEPFQCRCGNPNCQQWIRGFRHLSAEEQDRLRPWLAPYLLRLLEEAPGIPGASHTPEGSPLR